MNIERVNTLYGFRFRGDECIEGERYVICDTELFYKKPAGLNIGIQTEIKSKFPLKLYREADGVRCLGYYIIGKTSKSCLSLPFYHEKLKNLKKDREEVDHFFHNIIEDCGLNVIGEIDFVTVNTQI